LPSTVPDIESWGTDKNIFIYDAAGKYVGIVRHNTDPDAHWRKKGDHDYKKPYFGYDLTTAVTVREENGPDVPRATKAVRFRPALYNPRQMALACVGEVAKKQGCLGDVIIDREFTASNHGRDFLLPVRAMGGEPVFDLKQNQIGAKGTSHGAILIDGRPYSPSTPKTLWTIQRPMPSRAYKPTPSDIATYQSRIKVREMYALVPHGARQANGVQVYQCPASAGKMLCPLMASNKKSKVGLLPAANPPKVAPLNSVCDAKFRSFSAEELPLAQRHIYGSREWSDSYARRSEVERSYGNVKDQASESIRRGQIRVRGLFKMGLLVSFALASANVRLAASYSRNQLKKAASSPRAKRGRPRKHSMATYAAAVLQARHELLVVSRT
jgi:hypothetical protein